MANRRSLDKMRERERSTKKIFGSKKRDSLMRLVSGGGSFYIGKLKVWHEWRYIIENFWHWFGQSISAPGRPAPWPSHTSRGAANFGRRHFESWKMATTLLYKSFRYYSVCHNQVFLKLRHWRIFLPNFTGRTRARSCEENLPRKIIIKSKLIGHSKFSSQSECFKFYAENFLWDRFHVMSNIWTNSIKKLPL